MLPSKRAGRFISKMEIVVDLWIKIKKNQIEERQYYTYVNIVNCVCLDPRNSPTSIESRDTLYFCKGMLCIVLEYKINIKSLIFPKHDQASTILVKLHYILQNMNTKDFLNAQTSHRKPSIWYANLIGVLNHLNLLQLLPVTTQGKVWVWHFPAYTR